MKKKVYLCHAYGSMNCEKGARVKYVRRRE